MRVGFPLGELVLAGAGLLFLAGCAVGPRYSRPATAVPPAFKEVPRGWKQAQPADQVLRGKWWEIFQDPQLNALEEQIKVSNQTLKAADALATAADLESVNLSLHSELALDYFQMRSFDAEEQLLNSNVTAFEKALELTRNRYKGGVSSAVDVAQAQTQLETTRSQALDLQVQRAQFEHAIAVLIGQPASTFSLPVLPLTAPPPAIPPGLPSDLLERRPDIAVTERRMAAANARIGVARAASFPVVALSGTGGFESTKLTTF